MKYATIYTCLAVLFAAGAILSCQKEQSAAPQSLAAKYTDLSLTDLTELPNPAASEQVLAKLFDLKEQGNGLTDSELRSLGDPARNPDLLYALLFLEAYDRDEILWSWQEKQAEAAEETSPEDELADRSDIKKWTYTGGAPLASLYCSGLKKYPAYKLKNPFTDPCGDHFTGASYKCCFDLCEANAPVTCQSGCLASVTVPAGSVDALAAAIAQVCINGTVTLAAGTHTENTGVTISKNVTIQGEDGAILKVKSHLETDPGGITSAIAVQNTWGVVLKNFELQSLSGDGGYGITLLKSGDAEVSDMTIAPHHVGIIVEKSKYALLKNNVVTASTYWQTGGAYGMGIVIVNGERAWIEGNEISNAVFGVWACDQYGTYVDNYTHDNFIGLILCKVPAGAFLMPDGTLAGSAFSGGYWNVHDNKSTDNLDAGYIVIDGANHNSLKDNEGGSNGTYDIELVGDSYRFGFLTPKSSWNQVRAGDFPNVTIKDCGLNNVVIGGVKIDTGADPCF